MQNLVTDRSLIAFADKTKNVYKQTDRASSNTVKESIFNDIKNQQDSSFSVQEKTLKYEEQIQGKDTSTDNTNSNSDQAKEQDNTDLLSHQIQQINEGNLHQKILPQDGNIFKEVNTNIVDAPILINQQITSNLLYLQLIDSKKDNEQSNPINLLNQFDNGISNNIIDNQISGIVNAQAETKISEIDSQTLMEPNIDKVNIEDSGFDTLLPKNNKEIFSQHKNLEEENLRQTKESNIKPQTEQVSSLIKHSEEPVAIPQINKLPAQEAFTYQQTSNNTVNQISDDINDESMLSNSDQNTETTLVKSSEVDNDTEAETNFSRAIENALTKMQKPEAKASIDDTKDLKLNLSKVNFEKMNDIGNAQFKIDHIIDKGEKHITVKLHPQEFGAINFRIEMSNDGLSKLIVTADNREALAVLKDNIIELQEDLRNIGVKTGEAPEFNLKEGNKDQGKQENFKHLSYKENLIEELEIQTIKNYNYLNMDAYTLMREQGGVNLHV